MTVLEAAGKRHLPALKKQNKTKSSWERLPCPGVWGGAVCTSQPKTLLAGPSLGFSKTVSVPVRLRLNTDGAAEPACSVGKRFRSSIKDSKAPHAGCSPFLYPETLNTSQLPLEDNYIPNPTLCPEVYSPQSRMTWYVLDLISWFLARFPRAPFRSSSFTGGRFFLMGASGVPTLESPESYILRS